MGGAFSGLSSSLILTSSVPKACFERLLRSSHLLAVSTGLGCVFFQKDTSRAVVGRCSVKRFADRCFEVCRGSGSVRYRIQKGRKVINSYSQDPESEFLLVLKAPQAVVASGFSKMRAWEPQRP